MLFTATALLALLSCTLATPTRNRPSTLKPRQSSTEPVRITLTASSPNASFDQQPIHANSEAFYIGKPTLSYCPTGIENLVCPVGNETVISVGEGGASMYSEVPGGQPIYVTPSGNLSFTPAHLESIPSADNYTVTGFAFLPFPSHTSSSSSSYNTSLPLNSTTGTNATTGQLTFSDLGSQGWLACPTPGGNGTTYKIFADVVGLPVMEKCVGLVIQGTVWTRGPAVWQYQ